VVVDLPDGGTRSDPPRLVGNTLIYVHEGVTVRIEIAGDLAQALEVAALMR
jgi:hypothetical protein